MDCSQESTIADATAAAAEVKVRAADSLPVYVKELIAGGAAGALSKTAVAPLEWVKILFQVQNQQHLNHLGEPRFGGTLKGLSYIVQTQGWRQLFAGLSLNYVKVIPSVAIGFRAYDTLKSLLRVPPRRKPSSASNE
ncbi:hypothetical protein Cni_G11736 [Canna indica]|uniref:Uncharacterized protein n=1 Tax=Canna indica TaxID=4628 RepID=A0AAQ3QB49_9LILI|nr:hypothetical protein Cni_G11736 [Canna indica]